RPRIAKRGRHHADSLRIDLATGTLPRRKAGGHPPWTTQPQPALRGQHPYLDEPIGFLPQEMASHPHAPVPFYASLYGRPPIRQETRKAVTAEDLKTEVIVPGPRKGIFAGLTDAEIPDAIRAWGDEKVAVIEHMGTGSGEAS